MTSVMEKFEMPRVFAFLDGLQVRSDDQIFSKESPVESQISSPGRQVSRKKLAFLMAPYPVENESINILMNVLLQNYVGLARELLEVVD